MLMCVYLSRSTCFWPYTLLSAQSHFTLGFSLFHRLIHYLASYFFIDLPMDMAWWGLARYYEMMHHFVRWAWRGPVLFSYRNNYLPILFNFRHVFNLSFWQYCKLFLVLGILQRIFLDTTLILLWYLQEWILLWNNLCAETCVTWIFFSAIV